ncbi:MAG: hypothetical protein LUI10_14395 [Lachnospiraceae bacterium]|nr:hypothetical protein [Lachnospiraceae bacterium]
MIISFITILVTMYGWNSYEKHEMVNNAEDVKETYDKKIEPLAKMLQDKGMYNVESLQWIDRECEKKLKKENKMTIVSSFANTAIWPLVISIVTVSVEDVDIAILTRVCVIWVLLMSIFLIFILLVYSDMDMLINRKKKVLERLQTDIEYIYSQYDQLWKYQRSEEKIECCDE